jgi:hypothetical protein
MKDRRILGYVPAAVGACLLLAVMLETAAAGPLPPRPTKTPPTKTPVAGSESTSGGKIALNVLFDDDWPWFEVGWQDVQTVVQWQDPWTGDWHDVEGWQGGLDSVALGKDGVVGSKGWWVGEDDLNKGPFRWQVWVGDTLVGESDPFNLPPNRGAVVVNVNVVAP